MSKRKKKNKNQNADETPPIEVLEGSLNKKFGSYAIPVYEQFKERVQTHLDEDMDLEQLHLWEDAGPNAVKAMIESIGEAKISTLKSIRFWKINAQDEGVRALSGFLTNNKTVLSIDLLDNNVTQLGCEFLGIALHPKTNITLQRLMLDHNNIGTLGLQNLVAGIAMSPSLTHLSLSYCNLEQESANSLQLILAFINTKLSFLNLQGNMLQNKGVIETMRAVKINESLKELNLADNKFSDDTDVISEIEGVLHDNKVLFKLDLKYNEINEDGARKLMDAVKETKSTKVELTDRFPKDFSDEFNKVMKSVKGKKKGKKRKKKKKKK